MFKWLFRQVATLASYLLPSSKSAQAQFLKLIAYDYVRRYLFDHPETAADIRSIYKIVDSFALEFKLKGDVSARIVKATLFDLGIHPKLESMKINK